MNRMESLTKTFWVFFANSKIKKNIKTFIYFKKKKVIICAESGELNKCVWQLTKQLLMRCFKVN